MLKTAGIKMTRKFEEIQEAILPLAKLWFHLFHLFADQVARYVYGMYAA
jgi:hypothetical protein